MKCIFKYLDSTSLTFQLKVIGYLFNITKFCNPMSYALCHGPSLPTQTGLSISVCLSVLRRRSISFYSFPLTTCLNFIWNADPSPDHLSLSGPSFTDMLKYKILTQVVFLRIKNWHENNVICDQICMLTSLNIFHVIGAHVL